MFQKITKKGEERIPLEDIIYRSGVRRKALCVQPTTCRFCFRPFLDKYYFEKVHRVICPHCGMLNAKVNTDDIAKVILMGLRHDIGTMGEYGYHLTSKKEIIKIFKKVYGDQWKIKFDQLLEDLEITQKQFEQWYKIRKMMKKA